MEFALWIAATFLALAMFAAAGRKLIYGKAELEESMPWAEDFSQRTIWVVGSLEILGGLGVFLPIVLAIFPVVSAIAAFCIVALQVGAAATHLRRREYSVIPVNIVLICIALFIGVGTLLF
jgi:uncharacterized membrane protein